MPILEKYFSFKVEDFSVWRFFIFSLSMMLTFLFPIVASAQLLNGGFENRAPLDTGVYGTCTTGFSEARIAPNPWGIQSTPDYSTEAEVAFDVNYIPRSSLPGFDVSPSGGCFMGFRSLSDTANEGIFQTITISDSSQPLKWTYDYTEYTAPGNLRCTPSVEFRVNSNDDSNGTSISSAPNVGAPGGPSNEGDWVTLETSSFLPSDFGISNGGTMDVYVGVIANGCQATWGYVDALTIVEAIEANLTTIKTLASSDATPAVGDTVTFKIEVTNNGGADATGVSLTDLIPDGLKATDNNGDVTAGTYDNSTGVWSLGNLANGISATLTIEGTVNAGQGGNTIENITAVATADQTDPTTDGDDLTENVIVDVPNVPPAFPAGGGLSNSVCEAMPATNPYQDIGFRWEYNDDGGTNPNASIDQTSFIASATPANFSGVSGQVNSFDLNLNVDQIPANYDPNVYIEYEFTTQNFTNNAELTGFGATLFEATEASHIQDTGTYHIAIAIDDDVNFGSPDILINDVTFDGVDTSSASAATTPSDTGQYEQSFAHWDANGDVVSLTPETTYKMRIYPYGVTRVGKDNGQPYSNIVIFDDFMPKLKNCASAAPSLSMTKEANDPGPYTAGDVITYTYTVTNNGDQVIRDIVITDSHNGSDPAPTPGDETLLTDVAPTGDSTDAVDNGSWDVLAPGDVLTFIGTYTVTQTDVDNL